MDHSGKQNGHQQNDKHTADKARFLPDYGKNGIRHFDRYHFSVIHSTVSQSFARQLPGADCRNGPPELIGIIQIFFRIDERQQAASPGVIHSEFPYERQRKHPGADHGKEKPFIDAADKQCYHKHKNKYHGLSDIFLQEYKAERQQERTEYNRRPFKSQRPVPLNILDLLSDHEHHRKLHQL